MGWTVLIGNVYNDDWLLYPNGHFVSDTMRLTAIYGKVKRETLRVSGSGDPMGLCLLVSDI